MAKVPKEQRLERTLELVLACLVVAAIAALALAAVLMVLAVGPLR